MTRKDWTFALVIGLVCAAAIIIGPLTGDMP